MSYAGSVVAESLTCSICCELLNEPKLLACTHTFCEKCLHMLVSSQGEQTELPCPSCREITHLENGDISKLQTNIPINSLLEQLKSAKKFCTICDADSKSIALFYCWQCNEFLCESCQHAHGKFKKISSHDVVSVDDVKSGKVRAKHFCEMHPHEALEFVCSTCEEPICFRCRILYHSGSEHQVVEILAFQRTIQSQAKSLREESEKKTSAIEDYIAEVEEHLVKVGSVLDERAAEVHQTYEDRLQKLTEWRDELNNKIQQQRQMMIVELESIREVNTKSLAGIKSLCETVTKAAEGFIEGDALVAHKKICNDLEEMLEIDNPDVQELEDITNRADGLKFRRYQSVYECSKSLGEIYQTHGNQSALSLHNASITADMNWNLEKMISLSVAGARYSDMAPTTDGQMAVGYEMGGIDLFTPDRLQDTVLQDVKVNSVAVFSNSRYAVRDMDCTVTIYDSLLIDSYSMDTDGKGKLHVDQEDNLYVSNYKESGICTVFKLVEKELEESDQDLFEDKHVDDFMPFSHRCDEFICIEINEDEDESRLEVLHDEDVVYERSFRSTSLRFAVLRDDTILVGREEDGLVTIERYTYQLRYINTVLTGYRIDGEHFQLSQFSTGEIALCDGKALHVFRKA